MGAEWVWRAWGRTALNCLGPSRDITSILASPGVFLVRKTHWNTPSVKAVRTLARTKHLHRTIEIVGVVIVEPAHIRNF